VTELLSAFSFRDASLPEDADPICALVRDYDLGYAGRLVEPAENVVAEISAAAVTSRASQTVLAHDPDGALVGLLWWDIGLRDDAPFWCDVYVHPRHAGALEAELVGRAMAAARQWLDAPDRDRLRLESGTLQQNTSLAQVLQDAGFHHERTFWQMARALADDLATPPPPPPGVQIRRVADDAQGRALLHRILETSFRDHWNHPERSYEEFWQRKENHPGMDPSQWWVAELDGVPVGACIGDSSRAAGGTGHVQTLGVLREGRGRGVGQHLLWTAFAAHRARGWTRSELGVDADSLTGATRLYRSVGMEPAQVFELYVQELVSR